MTSHITDLQDQLSALEDKGDPAPSRLAILQIAATLALAQEVRGIGNLMAWGAPGDIPDRVPAEAGEMAREFEVGLSGVSKLHDCTRDIIPANRTWEICDACHYNEHCNDRIPF